MKEEDLQKAIKLKKSLDDKRELLQFANSHYVDLRVNLEERCNNEIRNVDYLLDRDVIKGLRAMVIANIEKSINDLQEELEKL
jgi:hypothetical protein